MVITIQGKWVIMESWWDELYCSILLNFLFFPVKRIINLYPFPCDLQHLPVITVSLTFGPATQLDLANRIRVVVILVDTLNMPTCFDQECWSSAKTMSKVYYRQLPVPERGKVEQTWIKLVSLMQWFQLSCSCMIHKLMSLLNSQWFRITCYATLFKQNFD
jgi:hypothetical protein